MKMIGFTGPRTLNDLQAEKAAAEIGALLSASDVVAVGCAAGLDKLALDMASALRCPIDFFDVCNESKSLNYAARLQERSKRMVRRLAHQGGTLHAFIARPCPSGISENSWRGSGTWGTIFYAKSLGVPIELHFLEPIDLPPWLGICQMALF